MSEPTVKALEWKSHVPGDGSGFATPAFVAVGIFETKFTILLSLLTGKWTGAGGVEFDTSEQAIASVQAAYARTIFRRLLMKRPTCAATAI